MDTKKNTYYSILALTLGDGYLQFSHGNKEGKAYIDIAHNPKNHDFIEYKSKILLSNGIDNTVGIKKKTNGNHCSRVWSKYYQIIGDVKRDLYNNNEKVFKKRYIKNLDAWALAIFWMDDGCLYCQKHSNKDGTEYLYQCGDLATQNFSYESQLNILEWLKTFGVEGYLQQSRGKYHIHFNRDNVRKLVNIVSPYIKEVPSMQYKIELI